MGRGSKVTGLQSTKEDSRTAEGSTILGALGFLRFCGGQKGMGDNVSTSLILLIFFGGRRHKQAGLAEMTALPKDESPASSAFSFSD